MMTTSSLCEGTRGGRVKSSATGQRVKREPEDAGGGGDEGLLVQLPLTRFFDGEGFVGGVLFRNKV